MEIVILGSSAAIPVKERNLPSTALRYKNELILFDCGEDLQRKFVEAGLKFNKPLKKFVSYRHIKKQYGYSFIRQLNLVYPLIPP